MSRFYNKSSRNYKKTEYEIEVILTMFHNSLNPCVTFSLLAVKNLKLAPAIYELSDAFLKEYCPLVQQGKDATP